MLFWTVNLDNLALWFCFKRFIHDVTNDVEVSSDTPCMCVIFQSRGTLLAFPPHQFLHLMMELQDSESGLQKDVHSLLEGTSRFQKHLT